jgi:hypothetical protein
VLGCLLELWVTIIQQLFLGCPYIFYILQLYILYFIVHEDVVFDWAKIILNDIFAQLMNFKREKFFYMASYLVFAITHCHVFKGMNVGKRLNPKIDHVTICYQALWR